MKKSTDQMSSFDEQVFNYSFFLITQILMKIKMRETSVFYEDEINLTPKISKDIKQKVQINLCYKHRSKAIHILKVVRTQIQDNIS